MADHDDVGHYRTMLRDSVRRLLADRWRPDETGGDTVAIWQSLAAQGLATLGTTPGSDDLPELLIVMHELGRVACGAPVLPAWLANVALGAASPAASGIPLAWSFGAADGDRLAGSVRLDAGRLSGTVRFVEHGEAARRLLLVSDDGQLCDVDLSAEGVTIAPRPGFARPALCDVTLDAVPAQAVPIGADKVAALHLVARLALSARALGAATHGFEMVLDHARTRVQFGQPIGQFQAIQHKLASSHILIEAASLLVEDASTARGNNPAAWPLAARMAITFCAQTLRQVALETQHCFGAIGFAEEHLAAKLFRRIHGDVTRLGGVTGARGDLAHLLFDNGDAFLIADSGGEDPAADLRATLRAWLDENWTAEDRVASRATPFTERRWNLPFARKLGEAGWSTLNWPRAAGGQERSPIEQLAYAEELLRAGAPDGPLVAGCRLLAPEVIAHGSPELRETLLPRLRNGTASVCLGYSEPESGSDLASLRTRAVFDGTDYVVNGQKIWTTDGHRATHMILAARTNPDPQVKHGGISLFVLPMDTPGITIRPTMAMYGHPFCNIFFDDVRIPAWALLGPLNGGWRILANALASERVVMGAFASQVRDLLGRIIAELKTNGLDRDPVVRDRIAGLAAEVEGARALSLRSIVMSGGDYTPLVESAMAKVYASEASQRLTEAAIDIFGAVTTLEEDAPGVPADGLVEQLLRQSIMMVVGGGTNEIQRNVIAQRGLGLPVQR